MPVSCSFCLQPLAAALLFFSLSAASTVVMGDTPLLRETQTPNGPVVLLPNSQPSVAATPAVVAPVAAPVLVSEAQVTQDPRLAPYAGHYGHSQQVPGFRWGWFGAEHFYPQVHWHRDYNGETLRWSHQRRY